jgi:hypothetical protein
MGALDGKVAVITGGKSGAFTNFTKEIHNGND